MSEIAQGAEPGDVILANAEVARRMLVLAELQTALAAEGVHCVLARHHRLVLRYEAGPYGPSGQTDPDLRIFAANGVDTATTDGSTYRLASGDVYSAADPARAAAAICRSRRAISREERL